MDASAYLQKQGWRGHGHSLDHTDRGIKKPLLVSKKVDVLGVGLNKHKAVSDQWWLRAFDQGLKTFGTGQESALSAVQKHGVNRGGLYARFIKGEGVPGSIGQSPVAGSETSTGASTPLESQPDVQDAIAIDVPLAEKLDRTVGHVVDQTHRDAMMHPLQDPDAPPFGMQEMLEKKRKRAERPVEKRARRKVERSEKTQEHIRENRLKATEKEAWDKDHELRRDEKRVNKQAEQYVFEAQRRGVIPAGPHEIRSGIVPTGAKAKSLDQGEPSEDFVAVISRAGFNPHAPFDSSGTKSERAQKYTHEKMKHEIKRAAKAYLTGVKPHSELTEEEMRAKKAEKKEKSAAKRKAAEQREAEKVVQRAEKKSLPPEKLAEYTRRAQEKGITIEQYVQRRGEKYAAKQAKKLGNPYQSKVLEAASGGKGLRRAQLKTQAPSQPAVVPDADENGLRLIVDTAGDDDLAVKSTRKSTVEVDGVPVAVIDTAGSPACSAEQTNMRIPLDSRDGAGIEPRDMPKAMRKAHRQRMKARPEERKVKEREGQPDKPAKKTKSQRKVEARENFVKQILIHSRKADLSGSNPDKGTAVTIEGVEGVPLVKVQSREGTFKKEEVALARTVARRVLRNVKREEKARKGKGKRSKKRERQAQEVGRTTGMSGSTDRATLVPGHDGRQAILA